MDAATVIIKPDDSYGDIQNIEDNDQSITSLTSVGIENACNANQTVVKSEPGHSFNFVKFRFSSSDALSSTGTPVAPDLDTSQSHEKTVPSLTSTIERPPTPCQETCIVENVCSSRNGLELVQQKRLRDSVVDKYESLLMKAKIANRVSRNYRLKAQIPMLTKSTLELQQSSKLSQECKYCFSRFNTFKSLFRHENRHKVVKQFTCDACGINVPRCNYKKETEQIPIVIVGDSILKKDNDVENVSLENSSTSGNNGNENKSGSGEIFECLVCDEEFVDIKKRQIHIKTHKSPFRCRTCNRQYKHLRHLHEHAKLAHAKKDFELVFKKEFVETFYSYSKNGIQKLGSAYKFVCAMCDMVFSERNQRTRHHLTHKPPFCCKFCSRQYKHRNSLYEHIRKAHIIRKIQEERGALNSSDEFFCAMCDDTFIDKSTRNAHHATHNPPFCCKVCDRKFKMKKFLYAHFNKSHPVMNTKKAIYYCSMCDVMSVDKSSGKAHHLTHMPPFCCKRCRKEFKSRNNVHIHFTKLHDTDGEDFFVLGSSVALDRNGSMKDPSHCEEMEGKSTMNE